MGTESAHQKFKTLDFFDLYQGRSDDDYGVKKDIKSWWVDSVKH